MVSGRHKALILRYPSQGKLRMLTRQLQELKSDKLVHWEVCPAFPHKIAYSPTETDFSRVPIPVAMRDWDRFICKTKIQSHAAL